MTLWRMGGWAALVAGVCAAYYGTGLAAVPFHPDESTYIYMSRDFATLFLERSPAALVWRPGQPITPEVRYRLLDAPLNRYLIGLGWWGAGWSAAELNADWVWSASWQANLAAGRIPPPGLLLASRWPAALLAALTAALVFGLGVAARGWAAGTLAAGLLALHPLMLLHGRRAMAEGPLLFTSALAVAAGVLAARRLDQRARPSLGRLALIGAGLGLLAGLALASKHSALVLGPAVLAPAAAAIWQSPETRRRRVRQLAVLGLAALSAAGALTLALNPVLWAAPAEALRAMWAARLQLSGAQTAGQQILAPGQVLPAAPDRLRAAVVNVYLAPPAVWDVPAANHLGYLEPQARAYFAGPGRQSPLWAGALLAGLTTAGLAFSALHLFRDRLGPATRAEQGLWAWGGATVLFTLLAVSIDWQRYFLPLLPAVCLFAALGLEGLAAPLARRLTRLRTSTS